MVKIGYCCCLVLFDFRAEIPRPTTEDVQNLQTPVKKWDKLPTSPGWPDFVCLTDWVFVSKGEIRSKVFWRPNTEAKGLPSTLDHGQSSSPQDPERKKKKKKNNDNNTSTKRSKKYTLLATRLIYSKNRIDLFKKRHGHPLSSQQCFKSSRNLFTWIMPRWSKDGFFSWMSLSTTLLVWKDLSDAAHLRCQGLLTGNPWIHTPHETKRDGSRSTPHLKKPLTFTP